MLRPGLSTSCTLLNACSLLNPISSGRPTADFSVNELWIWSYRLLKLDQTTKLTKVLSEDNVVHKRQPNLNSNCQCVWKVRLKVVYRWRHQQQRCWGYDNSSLKSFVLASLKVLVTNKNVIDLIIYCLSDSLLDISVPIKHVSCDRFNTVIVYKF